MRSALEPLFICSQVHMSGSGWCPVVIIIFYLFKSRSNVRNEMITETLTVVITFHMHTHKSKPALT